MDGSLNNDYLQRVQLELCPLFFVNKNLRKRVGYMLIVTNNPMVKENTLNRELLFKELTYVQILEECRNLIHSGYELLTHPLYGSVKPNETPYRSIILKKANNLDINSVTLIEDAIATATKFQGNKVTPNWPERVMDDFKVIDFDIFSNTLQRIEYV